ncbi:MAG: DUF1501 domain-containing protein [Planctomycetaceae bacterium]|nr:DUF1501 domain-containing protein [Planctomycetaceae bacterium]
MLTISGNPRRTCQTVSRRQILTAGGAGLLGLTLPKVLAASESSAFSGGRAKSVIFLFLFGGPSQFETFDMKPEAPSEIRGPFFPIASRTPGLLISEHLPRLAQQSDQYCVVRTMSHDYNDHSGGGHYIQTGHRWQIPVGGGFSSTPNDWPSMGSVVEYLAQNRANGHSRDLPSYAVVPNWLGRLQDKGQYRRPGQYPGWLGLQYSALTTAIDKQSVSDNPYWRDCTDEELKFEIEGLAPEVPISTIRRRTSLLEQFDESRRLVDEKGFQAYDRFRERAMALITSDSTREALDIRRESPELRDRYGRHLFGQSCLMARRLVESGVRFVTVHYDCVDGYSWDSHRNSDDVKKHLLPTFDQGCSALLADLSDRGLLDETLVVALGEMGRTPKGNATWGRNHWSTLFPALLAGAGVVGGTTYGRSDRLGERPDEGLVTPEDLAATVYRSLGIDPQLTLPDALGRPIPIVENGTPLTGLLTV